MKEEELRRCEITSWYPKFKSHTITTLFHPLPPPFIDYLLGRSTDADASDDDNDTAAPPPFLLPNSLSGRDPLPRTFARIDPTSHLDSTISDDDDDEEDHPAAPSFPDLETLVEKSIAELGGAAFPKLNWSAPKDASWIAADGSLKCSSFADVCLLLRSSDSIAHDLSEALASCSDHDPDSEFTFYLALRKWYSGLRPEMEFRCFCRGRRLIAVSQREVTNFYPVLIDRRSEVKQLIEEFFSRVVEKVFESENYTFDVYVTRDGRVKVVDFNPWGVFTLPLLFTWEELEGLGEGVEFRIVEERCGVRPGLKTAVPFDYLDVSEGSGWDQFLRRADEELKKQLQDSQGAA